MSAEIIQSGVRGECNGPSDSFEVSMGENLARLHNSELYGHPIAAGPFYDTGEIKPGVAYLGNGTCNVALPAGPGVDYLDICYTKRTDPNDEGVAVRSVLTRLERDPGYFVGTVPLSPGETYAPRVWGLGNPNVSHERLIVDPWARAIAGPVEYREDGSPKVPECVVVDNDPYDWEDSFAPSKTYSPGEKVIYEAHVDGLTHDNMAVPQQNRGKYLGVADPAVTEHLKSFGVTDIELLPVQQKATESDIARKGLSNDWGYNTLGFFAPDERFATDGKQGAQVKEFKDMVKALHREGLGIIMDVVYNHTPEWERPDSSMVFNGLGLDLYHKDADGYYTNYTGCGPDIDTSKPLAQDVILDSITYWVKEMGVDGFRFDLASALAREGEDGRTLNIRSNWFMRRLKQHVLGLEQQTGKSITLVFEPWDTGSLPAPHDFSEYGYPWSDKPRDWIRGLGRGATPIGDITSVLVGATNKYPDGHPEGGKLPPNPTVNFVTAHDGFTLRDLVSYNQKHNEANLERNRDGEDHNLSWNHGQEGIEAIDDAILDERDKHRRMAILMLALSRGIPMIRYGDELSHSQHGNNNSYCQPELNRINWVLDDPRDKAFLQFVQRAMQFRRQHGELTTTDPYKYEPIQSGTNDLYWLNGNGDEMKDHEWHEHAVVGGYRSTVGSAVLSYINTSRYDTPVHLPRDPLYKGGYIEVLNSATPHASENPLRGEDDGVRVEKDASGRIRLIWNEEITVPNLSVVALEPRSLPSRINTRSAHSDEWWYGKRVTDLLDAAKRSTQPLAA